MTDDEIHDEQCRDQRIWRNREVFDACHKAIKEMHSLLEGTRNMTVRFLLENCIKDLERMRDGSAASCEPEEDRVVEFYH